MHRYPFEYLRKFDEKVNGVLIDLDENISDQLDQLFNNEIEDAGEELNVTSAYQID